MALVVENGKKCFNPELLNYMKKQKTGKDALSLIANETNLRNLTDSTGSTLLHQAALLNCTVVAQYLVDQGCDVDARDSLGNTPLMLAVKKCSQKTTGVLLAANADMNVYVETDETLVSSVLNSRVDRMIKIFLNHIRSICTNDCNKIALKLKELDCPLHVAMLYKRVDVMKSMLDLGYSIEYADKHTIGGSMLQKAVEQGNLEMIKILVEYGADINAPDICNQTPLFAYTESRNDFPHEILQFFLDKGVDLTATSKLSEMLIFQLIGDVDNKSVTMLLPYIDFSERDPNGKTALHCLASNFHDGVIEIARNQNFSVDARDCNGQTPLMMAVKQNLLVNVKFLLEHGADVNLKDNNGETALTFAFTSELLEADDMIRVVELLLLSGANAQQLFNGRKTIFDVKYQEDLNKLYKPVLANLVMLTEARAVSIIEEIRNKISSNSELKKCFDLYKKQYEKLKKIIVDDMINLHDVLVANEEKITFYRSNPRFVSVFKRVIQDNKSNVNSYYLKTLLRRINNSTTQ